MSGSQGVACHLGCFRWTRGGGNLATGKLVGSGAARSIMFHYVSSSFSSFIFFFWDISLGTKSVSQSIWKYMKRTTSERMSRRCCSTTWIMSSPLKTRKPSADFFKHLRLLLLVVPRSCLWTVISIKPWSYCKDYWVLKDCLVAAPRIEKKQPSDTQEHQDLLNSIKVSWKIMKVVVPPVETPGKRVPGRGGTADSPVSSIQFFAFYQLLKLILLNDVKSCKTSAAKVMYRNSLVIAFCSQFLQTSPAFVVRL